jgi:hyperosmotically inducible periplasmic protein
MKTRLMLLAFVLLINNGLAWGGGGRDISNPAGRSSSKSEASDTENTERNVRDKSGATLTPEDQKESSVDRKITANIRRAVVGDESLSLNAHNVKIITRNRVVTLRGPVESQAEKAKIGELARKAAGVKRVKVNNQLEVKGE